MGVVTYLSDRLQNVFGVGTGRDKAAHSFYGAPTISQEEILNAYRGAWLPRKIVDIPALDSCRRWRNWQATKEQITQIEATERRLNLKVKFLQARTAARLFGGAALYIGTGEPNVEEELDLDRVKKDGLKYITVLTPNNLQTGEISRDAQSLYFNRPSFYSLTTGTGEELRIHPSRLALFYGAPLPEDGVSVAALPGWADPVLMSVLDSVAKTDATVGNVASLVFEAKIDIFRIPGLMSKIEDPKYEALVMKRLAIAALGKSINGALVMDIEEEYEQKTASFTTLPEIMDRFFQIVSGAADIPMTRLFGQAPAGMNATGESDLRNYYDRIQSTQELEITPSTYMLDEAVIRSATGGRDEKIYYNWASLWQTTDAERTATASALATTMKTVKETSVWPPETIGKTLANALIENGAFPGIEDAIADHGLDVPEPELPTMTGSPPTPGVKAEEAPVPTPRARPALRAVDGLDDLSDAMQNTVDQATDKLQSEIVRIQTDAQTQVEIARREADAAKAQADAKIERMANDISNLRSLVDQVLSMPQSVETKVETPPRKRRILVAKRDAEGRIEEIEQEEYD